MPAPALPNFFGQQAWIDEILEECANYLAGALSGMTTDRVFPSIWDDDLHLEFPPADRFITLFAGDFPVDQNNVQGGGAINTPFDAAVVVTMFTRVESDIENRSRQSLVEQVNGVYQFAKQVIAALQMWPGPVVTDDAANTVSKLRRPARIKPGWRVVRKKNAQGQRWTVAPATFEMSFVSDLGSPYPG